jgi:hypothetical protein
MQVVGWDLPMTYLILARDGTSRIVLKRESEDAATKKARELKEMGWFEVEVREDSPTGVAVPTDHTQTLQ